MEFWISVTQSLPPNLFPRVRSYLYQCMPPLATQLLKLAAWESLLNLPFSCISTLPPPANHISSLLSISSVPCGPMATSLTKTSATPSTFAPDSSSPFSVRQPEQSLQKWNWSLWMSLLIPCCSPHSFYLRSNSVCWLFFPQKCFPIFLWPTPHLTLSMLSKGGLHHQYTQQPLLPFRPHFFFQNISNFIIILYSFFICKHFYL